MLATPLPASAESGFQFQGFTPPFDQLPGNYHSTVATIVHGYLNTSFFGFTDPRLFPFASVLTSETPDVFFNSVASVCPVNISSGFRRKQPQEAGVYKVFSPQHLEKSQLKTLFRSAASFLDRSSWLQINIVNNKDIQCLSHKTSRDSNSRVSLLLCCSSRV